jgi:transketolase
MFVYLYYGQYGLHHYVDNFTYEDRDRLVIGKGHACLALYNIWEDLGIIKKGLMDNFGNNGSFLSGQLNINTNGVEYNTGSLGHAIGIASGMAMVGRMGKKDYFSIAFIGDGECSEGSIWEAIEFAGKQNLNKLMCIVDFNRLGVTEVINIDGEEETLQTRVLSYGWDCDIIDGHDFDQIEVVMKERTEQQKPIMVIAKTIKGKGISFMENGIKWHHSVPSEEEYIMARKELEKQLWT